MRKLFLDFGITKFPSNNNKSAQIITPIGDGDERCAVVRCPAVKQGSKDTIIGSGGSRMRKHLI
jgi:hypothetical protein